jgi:hypothetical protein
MLKRKHDQEKRPIIAKNLKLPKVFSMNRQTEDTHESQSHIIGGRLSSEDEMPFWSRNLLEERMKRRAESKREPNKSYIEGGKKAIYRSYKKESMYNSHKIPSGNKIMRASHSCPKYFDNNDQT